MTQLIPETTIVIPCLPGSGDYETQETDDQADLNS